MAQCIELHVQEIQTRYSTHSGRCGQSKVFNPLAGTAVGGGGGQLVLHRSSWVCMHSYCDHMMTQACATAKRGGKGCSFVSESGMPVTPLTILSACHQFGLPEAVLLPERDRSALLQLAHILRYLR